MMASKSVSVLAGTARRGLSRLPARRFPMVGNSFNLRSRNIATDAVRGTSGLLALAGKLQSYHERKVNGCKFWKRSYASESYSSHGKELAKQAENMGYAVLHGRGNQDNLDHFLVFGPQFLRENCQCCHCIHPDTRQRAIDPFLIPPSVAIESHVTTTDEDVKVKWSDGHEGVYPYEWLLEHQQVDWKTDEPSKKSSDNEQVLPAPRKCEQVHGNGEELPSVMFDKVMLSDSHVLEWLEQIWIYGFSLVKNTPATPEATKDLLERIAHIRHTHYGGFWDFTADLTFKDTAYTNEGLAPHTDNTYFSDPARLQLFHLLSHTDGSGGESTMLDGFAAAQKLHDESPSLYNALATVRHSWHSSGNEDVCIQPSSRAPVFSIHPDFGTMYQVRWNYYDQLPKSDWSLSEQSIWYKAARRYYEILNEPGRVLEMQLEPGTALIFDNWRMMHGRTEFTGKRRMCGGYTNNDDFVSRLRLLKFGREKVLKKMGSYRETNDPSSPYSIY